MPSIEDRKDIFDIHANFCSIFSSPLRLRILWFLGEEEKTVTELARELEVAVPNISQHLRIMRDQGAVDTRREGRTVYYKLANSKFLQGVRLIREGLKEELNKKISIGTAENHRAVKEQF
ncbi:MAG: ArsR/SmtB family transcription factor [Desulfurivibrionaceae bacterium]